jgi:hypothetical protein
MTPVAVTMSATQSAPARLTSPGAWQGGTSSMQGEGYCECGCGQKTTIARQTRTDRGWIKGQPKRWIQGHHDRKLGPKYIIEDRGYLTPCWIWAKGFYSDGYGQRRHQRAHRWMYEQIVGPIPEGLTLDHLCRVKACVNPDHLEPVTSAENVRRAPTTKLAWDDIEAIRASSDGACKLAATYGVSHSLISMIRRGKVWVR